MDVSVTSAIINAHQLEIYSGNIVVEGTVSGPFVRLTDLVNSGDFNYMVVEEASIAELNDRDNRSRLSAPALMRRDQVHFMSELPDPAVVQAQRENPPGREFFVRKDAVACYALTDTFAIYGYCHLLAGTTLANLLETSTSFFPLTEATIYLNSLPGVPWHRDIVVLNKEKVQIVHMLDASPDLDGGEQEATQTPLKSLLG
jgi:hypothetical protein